MAGKGKSGVFDFLQDPNFLNALAAMIGPLAFFAAPTEEIEHLLFSQSVAVEAATEVSDFTNTVTGIANAA